MAADLITYTDKVQGQNNPAVATKKCTFGDMNEIKDAVNGHAANIDELEVDYISALIPTVIDKEYKIIINIPYAGTIVETSTICLSGTATGTFSIGGADLGGTANSISSSENVQAHASANEFIVGDNIEFTISSNSTALDVNFTIKYTRTLA